MQEGSEGVGDIGIAEHFTLLLVKREQATWGDASDGTDQCRESRFDGAERRVKDVCKLFFGLASDVGDSVLDIGEHRL